MSYKPNISLLFIETHAQLHYLEEEPSL